MGLLANVSPFDALLLLLLVHLVGIVVAVALHGERPRATAPGRYMDRTVFAVLFSVVALAWWVVVAISPGTPLYGRGEGTGGAIVILLLVGVIATSIAVSNGRVLLRAGLARLRAGPPGTGDQVVAAGTARPVDGTVETPFAGHEALVAHATTEAYETGPRMSGWAEHDDHVEARAFAVERDGPTVHVHPDDAEWQLPTVDRTTVDGDEAPPERVAAGVRAHPDLDVPDSPRGGFAIERTRFVERALRPGDDVLVVGRVGTVTDAPVVDGGAPFVVTQGASGERYRSMLRLALGGGLLGALLLGAGFLGLAVASGLV